MKNFQKTNLRIQRKGFQKHWTLEQVKSGLEAFYKEFKRYPSVREIDLYRYLPSAKSLERSFGGILELRKLLGLRAQEDLRKGAHSRDRALRIDSKARELKKEVLGYLEKNFRGESFLIDFPINKDRRSKADFLIKTPSKKLYVDIIHSSNTRNLVVSVNEKLKKFMKLKPGLYEVLFVQMNEKISQEHLDKFVRNKKQKLAKGQRLVSWKYFKDYIKGIK